MTIVNGPLASHGSELSEELTRLGYAKRTSATLMKLAIRLSCWLDERGQNLDALSDAALADFVADLRGEKACFQPTTQTFTWLIEYLRAIDAVPGPTRPAGSRHEEVLGRYEHYLVAERGLVANSVTGRLRVAALFLDQHGHQLDRLSAAEVGTFMTAQASRLSVASAKNLATGLRSFLTFVHLEGLVSGPLGGAVPSAAGWSGAGFPRGLAPGQVQTLLASCDRAKLTGLRDYAILVVLARLGLRAAEVAGLRLEDIDWRSGEVTIRGKGRTEERLPLPADVGAAIADYLRRGRPRRPDRELFLRVHAPLRGLSPQGVSEVVRAASERTGLGSFGAHRLRHTLGTEMLRAGASLPEVAQVLRHRSWVTTSIYAKVDQVALGQLAHPWPGSGR